MKKMSVAKHLATAKEKWTCQTLWNEGDTCTEHQRWCHQTAAIAQTWRIDKEKIGFLVDTVHRVRLARENQTRPVIVYFRMRYFRNKIKKISLDSEILKEKKLLVKEDLTRTDKLGRNKLWPLVKAARKQGKRVSFHSPKAYIEGKKEISHSSTNWHLIIAY